MPQFVIIDLSHLQQHHKSILIVADPARGSKRIREVGKNKKDGGIGCKLDPRLSPHSLRLSFFSGPMAARLSIFARIFFANARVSVEISFTAAGRGQPSRYR